MDKLDGKLNESNCTVKFDGQNVLVKSVGQIGRSNWMNKSNESNWMEKMYELNWTIKLDESNRTVVCVKSDARNENGRLFKPLWMAMGQSERIQDCANASKWTL